MGLQKLIIVLLFMLLFYFSHASFAPLSNKNLVSENSQNTRENDSVAIGGDSGNKSKYTTVLIGSGSGGRSGGEQSNSSPQGGNGAVPVYAASAAAAAQGRNHKGGATICSPFWKGGFGVFIIAIALLSSLLLQISM